MKLSRYGMIAKAFPQKSYEVDKSNNRLSCSLNSNRIVHHATILYTKLSIDNKTNIQSKVKINYMNVKTKRHPIKYSLSCNNVGMFIPLLKELTHHGH